MTLSSTLSNIFKSLLIVIHFVRFYKKALSARVVDSAPIPRTRMRVAAGRCTRRPGNCVAMTWWLPRQRQAMGRAATLRHTTINHR